MAIKTDRLLVQARRLDKEIEKAIEGAKGDQYGQVRPSDLMLNVLFTNEKKRKEILEHLESGLSKYTYNTYTNGKYEFKAISKEPKK